MWSSILGIFPGSILMTQWCVDLMGNELVEVTLIHERPCGYIVVPYVLYKCLVLGLPMDLCRKVRVSFMVPSGRTAFIWGSTFGVDGWGLDALGDIHIIVDGSLYPVKMVRRPFDTCTWCLVNFTSHPLSHSTRIETRGSCIFLNLYAFFAFSGRLFIFVCHWICASTLFPSCRCALIGIDCWSYPLGLFMHKQFNVAPLCAIGSICVRRRLWEILLVLIVLTVSTILSGTQWLSLLYWLPCLLLARVASSWCPPLLDRHATLFWFISTQYPWVQQYPPSSRMCFQLTHLGGLSVIFLVPLWSWGY